MALTKVEAEQLQPAQTSITSVGTLTGLSSSGTLSVTNQVPIRETAPGIESGHSSAHSIQVGRWSGSNNRWMIVPNPEGSPLYSRELSYNFTTDTWGVEGSFAATLSTAAQPNITSVGTLTGLTTSGSVGFRVAADSNYAFIALQNSSLTHGGYMSIQGGTATGLEINASASSFSGTIFLAKQSQATTGGYLARFANSAGDKMVVETGGNVGIGTASPATALHVVGTTTFDGDGSSRTEINSSTASSIVSLNVGGFTGTPSVARDVRFFVNAAANARTERMRIDSIGNVIINKVNFSSLPTPSKLNIFGDGITLRLDGSAGTTRGILFRNVNAGNPGEVYADGSLRFRTEDASTRITFHTNSSGSNNERMRIDASGNVLVGATTDTTLYNNTSGGGIMLAAANRFDAARAGDVVATFNRSDSNGQVIQVYRSGTQVGSISAEGGDSMIVSGGNAGTSGGGLLFHGTNGKILPARNTASINDAIDLGQDSRRFKDIYITGGINFGAANTTANSSTNNQNDSNLLDEYEEGEFTPTITVQNGSATLNSNMDTLFYTKIGRQVTINGRIRFSSASASGYVRVSLPFANMSNISSTQGEYAYFSIAGHNVNVSADIYGTFAEASPGNNFATLLQKFDNSPWNYLDASAFSNQDYLYFAGTYFTNS